jgi:hypothetical protein
MNAKDGNADKNFMREFQRVTGFKKVRKYGEAHPISHLDLYPDDGFPPFVVCNDEASFQKTPTRASM